MTLMASNLAVVLSSLGWSFGRTVVVAFAGSSSSRPSKQQQQQQHQQQQPEYSIASIDLSQKWMDLVQRQQVSATVQMPAATLEDESSSPSPSSQVLVRYGVRLFENKNNYKRMYCEEFVEQVESSSCSTKEESSAVTNVLCDSIRIINETLRSSAASSAAYRMDSDFVAQLQLVRTLRPPPSPGFSSSSTTTSSVPPPYDPSTDSFLTGPLRLELRPLVAHLHLPTLNTTWDVFHNVSPADKRGHFLLLPTLTDTNNCRGQLFTKNDCYDMVYIANSIKPEGSLMLGFNSVGAGASQNHIHCHAWPYPPIPFTLQMAEIHDDDDDDDVDHDNDVSPNGYAVCNVKSIYDFYDIYHGKVEISYLKYPVFCLQLSASEQNLDLLGMALSTVLGTIGDSPYNIGFLNRNQVLLMEEEKDDDDDRHNHSHDHQDDDGDDHHHQQEQQQDATSYVDVFLFVRSKERSDIVPSLKLGISEMMGVFHAQSKQELEMLATSCDNEEAMGPMEQALQDVSYQNEEELWNLIQVTLSQLDQE